MIQCVTLGLGGASGSDYVTVAFHAPQPTGEKAGVPGREYGL